MEPILQDQRQLIITDVMIPIASTNCGQRPPRQLLHTSDSGEDIECAVLMNHATLAGDQDHCRGTGN
eukprot:3888417-Amphidinium_carterae.1